MELYKDLNLAVVRSEPTVWISRVVIFEKITPAPVVIRDVPLSRGLNIVWAEETEDDDSTAEISGHSAGKTTFCRFLRYVLGERTFGTKANMELIREAIPGGYVAAEMVIAGEKWAVRRPIGGGRMSYLKQAVTIEEHLDQPTRAVSHDEYVRKLGLENLLDGLQTARIVRTNEVIQWGHVLAWCTRDQEARFQSIHEWRSPRSQSESPGFQRPKEGPLFVMRAVLGLFVPDELKAEERLAALQRQKERLEKQIEEKRREPDFWVSRFDGELRRRLVALMPNEAAVDTLPVHAEEPLLPDLDRLVDRAATELQARIQRKESQVLEVQDQIDDLGGELRQSEGQLQQLEALFRISSAAARELSDGLANSQQQLEHLNEHQDRVCPFGDVLFRECSYVIERQAVLNIAQLQDAHVTEQAEARRRTERERTQDTIAEMRSRIFERRDKRAELQRSRDALVAQLRRERQALSDLERTRGSLDMWMQRRDHGTGDQKLLSLRQQLEQTTEKIERLESALTDLIRQHEANRDLVASIFSMAVRGVLSSGTYDGQVSLDNRELAFRITHGPTMSGEAIETLSVLLADIAALVYSTVSANAHLPGFFIHDSPREADLGARIYRSFIGAVAGLQREFGSPDHCPFQYILTTTTAPPAELRSKHTVKLPLNAGRVSGMLLRKNIAVKSVDPQLELFNDTGGEGKRHRGEAT